AVRPVSRTLRAVPAALTAAAAASPVPLADPLALTAVLGAGLLRRLGRRRGLPGSGRCRGLCPAVGRSGLAGRLVRRAARRLAPGPRGRRCGRSGRPLPGAGITRTVGPAGSPVGRGGGFPAGGLPRDGRS